VDSTLASGQNSLVVYPHTGIDEAAFNAGDSVDLADAPFKMRVIKRLPDDSYSLDIQIKD